MNNRKKLLWCILFISVVYWLMESKFKRLTYKLYVQRYIGDQNISTICDFATIDPWHETLVNLSLHSGIVERNSKLSSGENIVI